MFLGDDDDADVQDQDQEEEEDDAINIAEEFKNDQVTIQYGNDPVKAEFGGGSGNFSQPPRNSSQLAKNPRPEQQKPEGFGADFGGLVGSGVGAKGKTGGSGAPVPPTTGNKKT